MASSQPKAPSIEEDIKKNMMLLKSNNTNSRISAIRMLSQNYNDIIINEIRKCLNDNYPMVKSNAIIALANLNDNNSIDPIIALLSDDNLQVKLCAAKALGILRNRKATTPLIDQLSTHNTLLKATVIQSIGQIRDKSTYDILLPFLKDKEASIRIVALNSLDRYMNMRYPKDVAPCLDDNDKLVRIDGLRLLMKYRDDSLISSLQKALNDTDIDVRKQAVITAISMEDKRLDNSLYTLLKDNDPSIRMLALRVYCYANIDEQYLYKLCNDEDIYISQSAISIFINKYFTSARYILNLFNCIDNDRKKYLLLNLAFVKDAEKAISSIKDLHSDDADIEEMLNCYRIMSGNYNLLDSTTNYVLKKNISLFPLLAKTYTCINSKYNTILLGHLSANKSINSVVHLLGVLKCGEAVEPLIRLYESSLMDASNSLFGPPNASSNKNKIDSSLVLEALIKIGNEKVAKYINDRLIGRETRLSGHLDGLYRCNGVEMVRLLENIFQTGGSHHKIVAMNFIGRIHDAKYFPLLLQCYNNNNLKNVAFENLLFYSGNTTDNIIISELQNNDCNFNSIIFYLYHNDIPNIFDELRKIKDANKLKLELLYNVALAAQGNEDNSRELLGSLNFFNDDDICKIISAIGYKKNSCMYPVMYKVLDSGNQKETIACLDAIFSLNTDEFNGIISKLTLSPNSNIRERAYRILLKRNISDEALLHRIRVDNSYYICTLLDTVIR
ncbi:MAG: HEAT repeat domain-containing protein [Armatimonadota bacterium]